MDTGFNGGLSLPEDIIDRLELPRDGQRSVAVAGGGVHYFDTYSANALIHGELRDAVVIEANNAPLLGMALIQGSKLTIDLSVGGNVIIEKQ